MKRTFISLFRKILKNFLENIKKLPEMTVFLRFYINFSILITRIDLKILGMNLTVSYQK